MFSAPKSVDSPVQSAFTFTKRDRLKLLGGFALCAFVSPRMLAAAAAQERVSMNPETTGLHGFFNDDKSQFVDLWLNPRGTVTIKASNGRPWRPMYVVVHATYMNGAEVVATADYHVYCPSPDAGGKGKDRWFVFDAPNGRDGVTAISLSTNKEKPWGNADQAWIVPLYKQPF